MYAKKKKKKETNLLTIKGFWEALCIKKWEYK